MVINLIMLQKCEQTKIGILDSIRDKMSTSISAGVDRFPCFIVFIIVMPNQTQFFLVLVDLSLRTKSSKN